MSGTNIIAQLFIPLLMNQLKTVYRFLCENRRGIKWNKNKRRCVILYETI